MTKAEAAALWRILTVLAGWNEIVAVEEVDADLDVLLDALDEWGITAPGTGPFDGDDRDRMLDALRAEIEANLYYSTFELPLRRVQDVPGADKAGIT